MAKFMTNMVFMSRTLYPGDSIMPSLVVAGEPVAVYEE